MTSNKKTARLAGTLYLILVFFGIISLLIVPAQLYVWDDPVATLRKIQEHELLFRFGLASGMLGFLSYLFLPFVLYRLLSRVHKWAAACMVILAVASVPLSFMNMSELFQVLRLATELNDTASTEVRDVAQQLIWQLHAYNDGNLIAQIFWGLWLLPFGYLVYKSNILPKILGLFLMVGSVGYTFASFGKVLWIGYSDLALANYITIPASIGEIGTCLYLLILGAREYDESRFLPGNL